MTGRRVSRSAELVREYWAVALVCAYGLVLAGTAAVGTAQQPVPSAPTANLLDKPLGEDAFYMLSVARSIAEGNGLSYGGTHTTGIQPLATFLYAGAYWATQALGLSAEMPLRVVVAINVGLLLLTGVLSRRLVEAFLSRAGYDVSGTAWIVVTLVVVNAAAFRLYGYGLETGLYLATIAALQLALQRDRGWGTTGLLLGLCLLARLDFGVLGSVVFGWRLLVRKLRVVDALRIAAVALTIAGPWLLYVHHVTGGLMPSSGTAEAGVVNSWAILGQRLWVMVANALVVGSAVLYLPISDGVVGTAIGLALAGALWRFRTDVAPGLRAQGPWLAGAATLGLYYIVASDAGQFYGRYLAPFWLAWAQVVGAAASLVFLRGSRLMKVGGALAATLALLFGIQIGYTIHRGHAANSHLYTAFYISEHADALGTVGAFQSGLIGYVTHERVVNLDGKLDGQALAWRRTQHEECYLAQRGVTTVIDWPDYIRNGWIDPSFVQSHMTQVGAIPGGASVIMRLDRSADCR